MSLPQKIVVLTLLFKRTCRKLQATSAAPDMGFNEVAVSNLFDLVTEIISDYIFVLIFANSIFF
jgi:hypothetical protein